MPLLKCPLCEEQFGTNQDRKIHVYYDHDTGDDDD